MIFRLALTQMLFNAVFQFSNLFINTYLFKENHDIKLVALYNFYMYVFWGLCFFIGFRCCEKNTRIGQALSGVSCMIGVGLLMVHVHHPFFLGMFMGATGGFFWTSYLSTYRSLGKNSENGGMFARVSLLATLVTIFIPILFGYILEGAGYFTGFMVLFVLSIAMISMTFFIPSLSTERIHLTKSSFNHPGFSSVNVLQGFYFSFVNIAAGLLVYMAGKGEASIGSFATYYGIVTVALTFLIAYWLPEKYQMKAIFVSSLIYILSCTILWNDWSYSIVVFNFLLAFAGPLFLNPVLGMNFSYINQHFANGEEGLLIRELGLTVGKLFFFGYMAFFGLNIHSLAFVIFLLSASLFPLFISFIVKRWNPII